MHAYFALMSMITLLITHIELFVKANMAAYAVGTSIWISAWLMVAGREATR